jgi:hypothetical protein
VVPIEHTEELTDGKSLKHRITVAKTCARVTCRASWRRESDTQSAGADHTFIPAVVDTSNDLAENQHALRNCDGTCSCRLARLSVVRDKEALLSWR